MSDFDVFLSYNSETKNLVETIFSILTKNYFLKVWLDTHEPFSTTFYDKIVNGIGNSSIFLGLVSKNYCKSENNVSEIKFANNMNKSMMFILTENISKVDLSNLEFVFDWTLRFDAFKDIENFKNGNGKTFEALIKAIKREIVLFDQFTKGEKFILNNLDKNENRTHRRSRNYSRLLELNDGTKIIGEWCDYNLNGKAKIEYPSGETYEGNLIDQKRHGFGIYKFKNGDQYIGDWLNDKPNGKGKYKWINGDVYHGDFEENFQTGKGIFEFKNGEKYMGEFLNSKKHGKGKFFFSNGNIYDGMWVNDKMHGFGVLYFLNGQQYEGDFGDNKFISGKHFLSNSKDQFIIINNLSAVNSMYMYTNQAYFTPNLINNFSDPYYFNFSNYSNQDYSNNNADYFSSIYDSSKVDQTNKQDDTENCLIS